MPNETSLPRFSDEQPKYLLWTRMQAEAGQGLELILRRKECERLAGNGRFFWGVGNAPAVAINSLARMQACISVIFSKMKSKPKAIDRKPSTTVIWRRYIDHEGRVRPLPANALVTSRGESPLLRKRSHYALECFSATPLRMDTDAEAFDPSAYRNASGSGKPVGASQVTSLLVPVPERVKGNDGAYSVDMRAVLCGSYWVKLVDPLPLSQSALNRIDQADAERKDWTKFVEELRGEMNAQPEDYGTPLLL